MSNETISLGSCKTCGAPAQFLDDGTTRYVDIKQDEIDRLRAELEQERETVRELEGLLWEIELLHQDKGLFDWQSAAHRKARENVMKALANSEKEGK